jgi:hypothetical protein
MVSEKQLAANRRNARNSTGPKSREGKARVAQNATTHGIFCRPIFARRTNPNRHQFVATVSPAMGCERK